ncbi:MAG: 16S rRNA (cytosine(1402)-N(4))-methyltransferase [Deltaproteobacteria bacterium CG11_big_fil_rev_8_21_14_0_20_49_13]|nr:MAG: 16S rRNA (cytosine(1402)-N(4))-methyltransferase [Deltaproteobacteria bacterium CG11_big_fil_rev_8_21_14_0_20_49_13]
MHIPVLLNEVIDILGPKSDGVYFDGTLGFGGYAEAMLKKSSPHGKVIATDFDDDAIEASKERLAEFGERFVAVKGNFSSAADIALERNINFDGMVLDLGVSSCQFDKAAKGFSFSKEGPLDMRMDKGSERTASDMVNNYSGRELEEIFKTYGEEKFARRIATKIIEKRNQKVLESTRELEEICFVAYPPNLRHGRVHPATKVFQALRIVVNSELENLERFLKSAPHALNEGGKIVVVSYHSLEDRIVKRGFKSLGGLGGFKVLTKKPVIPTEKETEENPRARSAKLRAIVKNGADIG